MSQNVGPSIFAQGMSAFFYAFSSLFIMFVNKFVLSTFSFPSSLFLAFAQSVATLILLVALKAFGLISYPGFSFRVLRNLFPLPLFFLMNTITGLASTKNLNIPMLTVLRRFSIVMTLIGEMLILNSRPSIGVYISVALMVVGACVAAIGDLNFDLEGYALATLNNFFTAANGVISKQKMEEKEVGTFGVMFYNTLLSLPILGLICLIDQNQIFIPVSKFEYWTNNWFLFYFFLSAIMGFVLNYSMVLCTKMNSPLTTTIVGSLKNILSTYLGMLMGDYIFDMTNFIGLNISVAGSLLFSQVKFMEQSKPKVPLEQNP